LVSQERNAASNEDDQILMLREELIARIESLSEAWKMECAAEEQRRKDGKSPDSDIDIGTSPPKTSASQKHNSLY
jgi:hypothetical protein